MRGQGNTGGRPDEKFIDKLGVELEQRADDFLRLSDATANAMTPLACTKRRRVPAVHWAMLAAIVVAVVAARTVSPRRLKPKVN